MRRIELKLPFFVLQMVSGGVLGPLRYRLLVDRIVHVLSAWSFLECGTDRALMIALARRYLRSEEFCYFHIFMELVSIWL